MRQSIKLNFQTTTIIKKHLPLIPENSGCENCELNDAKCGGKNSGGVPLSSIVPCRKLPLVYYKENIHYLLENLKCH